MADRTVSVSLVAKVQGYVGGIATASAATKEFSGELDKLAVKHKEKFSQIGRTTTIAGLALTGVFAAVVKAGMDFDKQMSEVASVSGATGKSLSDLSKAALQAGKDTAFTATDAAKAEAELAKAGISTADILGGALKGALSLASAGQMDLADAATLSAQAMNIFKLSGSAVPHIADVLASAANTSAADMQGLGDSLKQAGLVAAGTGATLEDTVGVLAAFADSALSGSDAGTSLKTMLGQLQAPSDKSAALMQRLGINAYDASGKFIGLTGLAGNLEKSLGTLTQQERDEALAQIFGNDGRRAAAILYDQGAAGIAKYITQVDQSGAAAKTAAQKMNNLSGDLEQLRGSVETLAIESGGSATKGLRTLTQAATGTVNAFMELPGWLQQTVTDLAGLSGGSILALTGLVKVRGSLKETKTALEGMGPAGTRASKALSGLTKWGGYAAAAGLVVFGLVELFKYLGKQGHDTAMDIDGVTDSLQTFSITGQATGELAKKYGKDLSGVTGDVRDLVKAQADLATQQALPQRMPAGKTGMVPTDAFERVQDLQLKISNLQKGFAGLDAGLAQEVNNGNVTAAANTFALLRTELQGTGIAAETLFPQYVAAAGKVQASSVGVGQGFATVQQQSDLMTAGLQDAIDHGNTLVTVFKQINGAAISTTSTAIDYKNSLATLSAAVEKNIKAHDKYAHSLSENTQEGRDNLSMILDSIDKADKSAEAVYEQTNSVDKANGVWATNIQLLKDQLKQLGFTPAQIQAVIDKYAKMPPVKATNFTTPGLDAALVKVGNLVTQIAKIKGKDVTIGVHSNIAGNPFNNRWGGTYTHAATGSLREAQTFSAVSGPGARYAFAEGGTGGEAFIPRFGDYGRSMGILATAAGWLGARVWPGGTRGGDGAAAPVTYHSEMNVYTQSADPAVLDQYMRGLEVRQRVGRRQ